MLHGALSRLGDADNVMHASFRSMSVSPAQRRRRRAKVATDGEVQRMDMPLHFRVAPEPLWLIKPGPGERDGVMGRPAKASHPALQLA